MTGTAEFEVDLLAEKNNILNHLSAINAAVLKEMKYIDKKKALEYYNQIDMIIFSIGQEYEEVRKRGNTGPLFP